MRLIVIAIAAVLPLGVAFAQTPGRPDCSADGIVVNALTGEPIPRARVGAQGNANGVADAAGHWALTGVLCGKIRIGANKTGFISSEGLQIEVPAHDVKIVLTPHSVVTGRVVDEFGDPVQQVRVGVLASRVLQGRRTFQFTGQAVTDDLGQYRIAPLRTGMYIVCATPLFQPMPTATTAMAESCYPGPPEGGPASAMEIGAGRETQVNFTLHETAILKLKGTVTGGPKGGSIAVSLQSRVSTPNGGGPSTRSSSIRPDGSFTIVGVAPGSYIMAADYWEEGSRLTARVPVTIGSSDVENVVVHMEPAFQLGGVVRVESSRSSAMPKQPWALNLRSQDPNGGGAQVTWSADLQSFTVREAPAGVYKIEGNPPAPFYVKSAMLDGRDLTREAVPIARSGGRIEVVISDDSGSLEGSVEDSDGQPVGGAAVVAMIDGRAARIAAAGNDGRFRISGLPPGDYQVSAWNDASLVEYADSNWMNAHARTEKVNVGAGQTGNAKLVEQVVK